MLTLTAKGALVHTYRAPQYVAASGRAVRASIPSIRMLTYAHVCSRMHTYAHVPRPAVRRRIRPRGACLNTLYPYAHVCSRMLTYAGIGAGGARLNTHFPYADVC
jgi:hypothetical protein